MGFGFARENASEKGVSNHIARARCFDRFCSKRRIFCGSAMFSTRRFHPVRSAEFVHQHDAETGTHATPDIDTRHAFAARTDCKR
jgi:hypothetical protein